MAHFQFIQRGRDLIQAWSNQALAGDFLERRDRDLEDFLQLVPGTLGFALFTGPNNDPYGADRLMTGLSLTLPFEAGRRIKVTVAALLLNDASAGRVLGTVQINGAGVGRWSDCTLAANGTLLTSTPVVWFSTRGVLEMKAHLQKNSGGGTVGVNSGTAAYILVEDTGPA